jgi:ubiquinone/menaquinone biosynthesis C-methylase UbiE
MSNDRRFDPKKCDALLSAERWARWKPPVLLAKAGAREGHAALDLGCGPGFWTLPLADIVGPSGHVFASDVSRELLDALVARNPPSHVLAVRGELPAIEMPDASVDFVWAAFVFHEVEEPLTLALEIRSVLRPGGRVAVLDWRPDASGESGPPRKDRISPEGVCAYLKAGGFLEVNNIWNDDDTYLVTAG